MSKSKKNANATGNTTSVDDSGNLNAIGSVVHNEENLLFTVRVISAKNLRGLKGEHVNSFVRVQFADFDYKESQVVADTANPEFNFHFEQAFHVDENLVDTFANKKLSFTLIESLPKEKTQILGTTEVCLGTTFLRYPPRDPNAPADAPLQLPILIVKESAPVLYSNTRLLPQPSKDSENSNMPELLFEAFLSRPLIPPEIVENGNFLNIKLEDAFPVPDEWTLKDGTEKDLNSNIYNYFLNFSIPAETTVERLICIPGGTLMSCEVPLISDPPVFGPQPIFMSKATGGADGSSATSGIPGEAALQDIKADGTAPQTPASDKNAEKLATVDVPMQTFKKISWSVNHTVWLPPEAVVRLREKIVAKQAIEIEFNREFQPRFSHLTDPNTGKYRGKTMVDVGSLLFPRVLGLRGRFLLDAFDPPNSPCAGDGTSSMLDPGYSKSKTNRAGKDEPEMNFYKSLGTHIGLEIVMEKPLLDKKKLQPIVKSVNDFIPRRIMPSHMLFEKRSQKADEDYHIQVQEIVRNLLKEFKTSLISGDEGECNLESEVNSSPKTLEEEQQRKKKFLFHLNRGGYYFSFKERLKIAVVDVVRERFQKKSPFTSKAEMQLFMSEVYVYLVDQMHVAVNNMLRERELAFMDPTVSKTADFSLLKQFADLAETDHETSIAATYHQERIAKFEDSMQVWFDYGCFCMRNSMPLKGVECFREILSRNSRHIPSLLALGSICCGNEKYEEGRVYLVTAVDLQPKYVLGLVILGLFYDVSGEEVESEKLLLEALKVHKATAGSSESIFIQAATFLIQAHAGQLAERALSQELLSNGPTAHPYLLLAQLEIQRTNYSLAADHIREALEVRQDDPDAWAFLAHLQYIQKLWPDAQASYETVLSLPEEPKNISQIYIRLGSVYLVNISSHASGCGSERTPAELNLARSAKTMFLRACEISPSSKSWLGVGRACFATGDYQEAEDALSEANVLNNRDGEVWAHLALLCLSLDRTFEANQAIAQALRLGVKDVTILAQVGSAFQVRNLISPAAECLRIALEIDPTNVTLQDQFLVLLRS